MLQCSVTYNHFSHRLHATLVDLSAKKALLCKNSLQRPVLLSWSRRFLRHMNHCFKCFGCPLTERNVCLAFKGRKIMTRTFCKICLDLTLNTKWNLITLIRYICSNGRRPSYILTVVEFSERMNWNDDNSLLGQLVLQSPNTKYIRTNSDSILFIPMPKANSY